MIIQTSMMLSALVPNDHSLAQQLRDADQKYLSYCQQALYNNYSIHDKLYIRHAGTDSAAHLVLLVFGIYQDNTPDKHDRIYLNLINSLEKHLSHQDHNGMDNAPQFTIVFYNTLCPSSTYASFKETYKSLPCRYFDQLKRMVVVDAGFSNKALGWFSSGTISNYLNQRTQYVDETVDLANVGVAVTKQFKRIVPKQIRDEERRRAGGLCFPREITSDDQEVSDRIKLISSEAVSSQKESFNKPRLDDYDSSGDKIPIVLKLLVSHLQSKPQYLDCEGIFRRGVSIDDQTEAKQRLCHKDYKFINQMSPSLTASLICPIFSSLRDPVIPYPAYHRLLNNTNQDNIDMKLIRSVIQDLPAINQANLGYLLNFVRTDVVVRHKVNRMTSYNMATVLMPSLMRSENPLTDLVNAKKCVKIIDFMIIHSEEIFGNVLVERPFLPTSSAISKGTETKSSTVYPMDSRVAKNQVSSFPWNNFRS